MKRGLLVILFLSFTFNTISQEKSIYVIAGQGCPANCANEFSPHYPVHLFKIINNNLHKIMDIADGSEYVFKIGQYNDFRKVIIYKSAFKEKTNKYIILNYGNRFKVDTLIRFLPEESFSAFTYYIVISDKNPFLIFEYYPDFNNEFELKHYYGINLTNYSDTLFDNNIIKFLHSEGEQGLALVESTDDNSEIMKIRTKILNNKPFYYILYPRLFNSDTATFSIPKLDELSKLHPYILWPDKGNEFAVFPLVNENVILICSSIVFDEKKQQGRRIMQMYNRQTDKWDNPEFRGVFSNAYRQINDWLVGYEAYSYSLGYYQKIRKHGSIPGKEFRKDSSLYGIPFDERANWYKIYPEGVLYIYNINSGKYIEWEALENGHRQGDSEVLYIEDEMVYYRINDKLYRAKILNGEKLGKSELLVQDDRIVDVHWLFLVKE